MSFDIGIIGLPNAGKSTLFKLLTEVEVDIDSYPFTTIDPNVGIVEVADERLEKIAQITEPNKQLLPTLKFVDIAGLIEGAHKGEGLGNEFLSQIKGCDGLVHVIRNFTLEEEPSPTQDRQIIEKELLMKDLELANNLIEKTKEKERLSTLEKIQNTLEKDTPLKNIDLTEEEIQSVREFQFLTLKPILNLYNGEKGEGFNIDLKIEEELKSLSKEEKEELEIESNLNQFLHKCNERFNLITFFTIANNKTQGWTIEKGTTVKRAGGRIHSDFEEKFKRAEVTNLKGLKSSGSFQSAKREGKVKTIGEDYQVQDGDIIEFKI